MDYLLSVDEVKQHLRIDENDLSEDDYLKFLVRVAIKQTETFTNRNIYLRADKVPEGEENALVWDDNIKLGVLLLIGHIYENRETATDAHVRKIPYGFESFIGPYKYIPV